MASGQYLVDATSAPSDPWIPNPTYQTTFTSAQAGNWDEASTWTQGRAPLATDKVQIDHAVTIRDQNAVAQAITVESGGKLTFSIAASTKLVVDTIAVPNGGTLEIGTPSSPLPVARTAEIEWRDTPLDRGTVASPGADPGAYWGGLLVVAGGRVEMCGAAKTAFGRCAQAPVAGSSTLVLQSAPTGWQVGDLLYVPDTFDGDIRHGHVPEWEYVTIAAINGATITLTAPLAYTHQGAFSSISGAYKYHLHIANLTRNIVMYSANPSGVRGHMLCQGTSYHDIRYARFKDMGRTQGNSLGPDVTTFDGSGNPTFIGPNQIARYPWHAHHLRGTLQSNGYYWTAIGNVVDNEQGVLNPEEKWAYAIHASHDGLLQSNIALNMSGALIVTEDGSEARNVIDGNFAARGVSSGTGWRYSVGGPTGHDAREGNGIWCRGPLNYIRNNVVVNCYSLDYVETAYGYKYLQRYLGPISYPANPGDPMSAYVTANGNYLAITEFSNNECYACDGGMTYWWINTTIDNDLNKPVDRGGGTSTFQGFVCWHIDDRTIFHYPAADIVHADMEFLDCQQQGNRWLGGDYEAIGLTMLRCTFDNLRGTSFYHTEFNQGTVLLQDCVWNNCDTGIRRAGFFQGNGVQAHGPGILRLVNPSFTNVNVTIQSQLRTAGYHDAQIDDCIIENYNGTGQEFACYYTEQVASTVMRQTLDRQRIGAPAAGLTNAQNWAAHRLTTMGRVMPTDADNTSRPEIVGYTGRRNDLIVLRKANADNGVNRADMLRSGTDWVDDHPACFTTPGTQDATVQVYLKRQPTADVTVTFTVEDTSVATVSPSSLTFNNANWNTPKTLTVTGGNTTGTTKLLSNQATSSDARYDGLYAETDRTGAFVQVSNQTAQPLLYDCGAQGDPVAIGYTQCTPNATYSDSTGGFGISSNDFIDTRDRGASFSDLRRDFLLPFPDVTRFDFEVCIPPGDYQVALLYGDGGGSGNYAGDWEVNGETADVPIVNHVAGQFYTATHDFTATGAKTKISLGAKRLPLNGIEFTATAATSDVSSQSSSSASSASSSSASTLSSSSQSSSSQSSSSQSTLSSSSQSSQSSQSSSSQSSVSSQSSSSLSSASSASSSSQSSQSSQSSSSQSSQSSSSSPSSDTTSLLQSDISSASSQSSSSQSSISSSQSSLSSVSSASSQSSSSQSSASSGSSASSASSASSSSASSATSSSASSASSASSSSLSSSSASSSSSSSASSSTSAQGGPQPVSVTITYQGVAVRVTVGNEEDLRL